MEKKIPHEKFMLIDSSYRDRAKYQHPCDFVIESEHVFTNTHVDPVVDSIPFITGKVTPTATTTFPLTDIDPAINTVNDYFKGYYFNLLNTTTTTNAIVPVEITGWNTTPPIPVLTTLAAAAPAAAPAPAAPFAPSVYFIRKKKPLIYNESVSVATVTITTTTTTTVGTTVTTTTTTTTTTSTIVIPHNTILPVGHGYTNYWISTYIGNKVVTAKIVDVRDGTIGTATVTHTVLTIDPPLSTAPITVVDIHSTVSENFRPIIYNMIPNNQTSDYEVKLVSLTIPNKYPVISGYKGVIDNYPYLIVGLTNVNSGNSTEIYSNNPNAINSAFVCPNIGKPDLMWLEFNCAMTQTLKFRMGGDIRFTIKTPQGGILELDQDAASPNPPNPLLQVSAVFSVKKL
jgi:hypothetical protein